MSENAVQIPLEEFRNEALRIVTEAKTEGIELRILGGLAVYLHSEEHHPNLRLHYEMAGRVITENSLFADLDLIGYSSQRTKIAKLFEKKLNFEPDRRFNMMFGLKRMIYADGGKFMIDLFFDKMEYSHDIEFGSKPENGRLALDFPTISLADLLLTKLQIHKITSKDIIDISTILLLHELGNGSKDTIDLSRISRVLADDWGFWYDAVGNLKALEELHDHLVTKGILTGDQEKLIEKRAQKLLMEIEKEPKTKSWEKRSKTGTSKPWFREVEEVFRT
jgi:hypothetical protein